MKELLQHIKPEVSLQSQKQITKRKELVDILIPKPGMKLWELNKKTGKIEQVEFESKNIVYTGKPINHIRYSITQKENCLYCVAINYENAEKKLLKKLSVKNNSHG